MYSTQERKLIFQYNLPLLWCDYTEKDDEIYMQKILPILLNIPNKKPVEKKSPSSNIFDLLDEE